MNLTIHTDGGARGNPGPAGIAVVLKDRDTGRAVHEAGYYVGRATNNVAEYLALIRGLELAQTYHATSVSIHMDSELIVKQITGEYRVKSPDMQQLHQQAQMLMLRFDTWQIKHIYREQNKRADELVNLVLDAKADVIAIADGKMLSITSPGGTTTRAAAAPVTAKPPASALSHSRVMRWTATVTSRPANSYDGGCEMGQTFEFGPSTPQGMCVYAAQAMFAESPITDLNGNGPRVTIRCPRCGCMLRIEMLD